MKNEGLAFNDEEQKYEVPDDNVNLLDTENLDKTISTRPISKGMLISEAIDLHPDIAPIIMDYGVHCIGCGGASFETIEEGFMGHGIPDDEIDRIIDDLNEFVKLSTKKK